MHILKHGDRIRIGSGGPRWHVVTARGRAMEHGADPDRAFRESRHAGQTCYLLMPESLACGGFGAGAFRPGVEHRVRVTDPVLIEGEVQRVAEGPGPDQFRLTPARRPRRGVRPLKQDAIHDYWSFDGDLVIARDRQSHVWRGYWVPAEGERSPRRLTDEGIRVLRARMTLYEPDGRRLTS